MSDVVLVYPRTGMDLKKVSLGIPLPLLAVASEITGDFKVRIIDQRVHDNWESELIRELKTRPLCVGITAITGHQIFHGMRAAQIVRENSQGIPVVWGGMHVTVLPEQSLQHPLVDMVIRGDGEWAFRDLVHALADKKPLSTVGGLSWKKNGEIIRNPDGPAIVLDETKPYPFELVDVENYVSPGEYRFEGIKRLLPFMGSRGCPFKCTFCAEPALTKVYRMMKPELVYERASQMVRTFKLDMVIFHDEEFFANAQWGTRVAELINNKFKWWTQTRANDLLRVDLKKMEQCGLFVATPGLESGSDRILKFIKKGETVKEYREVNRRLAETGIHVVYNFMMGFPTETREELYETIDLAMELLKENPKAFLHSFALYSPLPGTELLAQSKQWGYNPSEDLEAWIETSRHNFVTPWLKDNMEMYLNLAYTSRFVGPRAKMMGQGFWWLPPFIFDLYSWLIQRNWKKRRFKQTFDVKLLQFLHKKFVNPILTRKKSSVDGFTLKK